MSGLPAFRLHSPTSYAEAARLIASEPGTRIVAGGTDLLPNLRRGLAQPPQLVDLSRAHGGTDIELDGDALVLDAGVTLARLAADPRIQRDYAALAQAALAVAGPSHRNAATLGGNLCQDTRCVYYNQSEWWRRSNDWCLKRGGQTCHVAPQGTHCHAAFSGDLTPALIALGATVELLSVRGARALALEDCYRDDGAAHLALEADEVLVRVRIPAPQPGWVSGYRKMRVRGAVDFPLAGVACALGMRAGRIVGLRVALTGTNSRPLLLEGTEGLVGRAPDDAGLAALGKLVQRQVSPMRTTVTQSNYRRQVAAVLAQRLLRELADVAPEVRVRWRCESCATVNEGFAFAYGRCPTCGEKLIALGAGPRDENATLEGIRTAFELELGGRAFYQRAAAETADPGMKALFARFAVMEGEHMETLARRYRLDIPLPSPAFRVELAALFAGIEHRPQDPANLFRIAIGVEQRAAQFFAARAAAARADSAEHALYRELAEEEREHARVLASEYEQWRTSRPDLPHFALLGPAAPHASTASAPDASNNAAAVLLARADARRTALVCAGTTLTYGALREQVARAGAFWRAHGIQPGDRVAIKLTDGIDWAIAHLGAMWAGAVAVPVNPRVPAPEWHYILDEAGFSVILAQSNEDTPSPWRERTLAIADFQRGVNAAAPIAAYPVDREAPALWVHSSGTSGRPKAVVHPHRFALAIEEVSRDGLGISDDDRLFASSKLFFPYPQANSLWAGLKLGATVILDAQWPTATGVASAVGEARPSVLFSVPSLYRNLLHEGLAPEIARAGVRLCVSAGEALPQRLREEWRRQTGLTIVDGYGASETFALVMLDRGDGRGFTASPGVAIRPLERGTRAVSEGVDASNVPDVPTRLRIDAPTIALGYLDRPQAQREHFRGESFCPADLFAPTAAGARTWRFAGREDSLVKIHGRWVNLIELEERLGAAVPGVREIAAVLVPDADGVDAVACFFTAADEAAAGTALRAAASGLPPYQRPLWWYPLATLPRGPTGKLLRRALQALHRIEE